MSEKTEKPCKVCREVFPTDQLSNKRQCYQCSRDRMLKRFDDVWAAKHPEPDITLARIRALEQELAGMRGI